MPPFRSVSNRFPFFYTPKVHADAATDEAALRSKFKVHCDDRVLSSNCMHTACYSTHFVKAAALTNTSKKKKVCDSERTLYFVNLTRKYPILGLSNFTLVDVLPSLLLSIAYSRILATTPPLLFLSAWKDGCFGGGSKLWPGALS